MGNIYCSWCYEVERYNDELYPFTRVEFEGLKFMAPARYHEYLTHRYGDYMQLPPEDQRHPYHGVVCYWK